MELAGMMIRRERRLQRPLQPQPFKQQRQHLRRGRQLGRADIDEVDSGLGASDHQ